MIHSILVLILAVVLMISCEGVDNGEDNSNGDDSTLSIFTNFDECDGVYAIAIDSSGGKWFGHDDGVSGSSCVLQKRYTTV